MEKSFNLVYFKNIFNSDNKELLPAFLKLCDHQYFREKKVDSYNKELEDLDALISNMADLINVEQASGYFMGYKLNNNIDEEFDLLRFSKDSILNIELKDTLPKGGMIKVEEQLLRHKYILSILGKEVKSFVYIKDENNIYKLVGEEIQESDIRELSSAIDNDYVNENQLKNVDMSKFLISPYSQPETFHNHEYFLSQQQSDAKTKILQSSSSKICIEGEAGTGKSLLLFDVGKDYSKQGKKVILFLCAKLNKPQVLTESIGFDVKPIKSLSSVDIGSYDVILIDETQRIYREQLDELLMLEDKTVIFSIDQRQVLSQSEKDRNIINKIKDKDSMESVKLKNKIRTNPSLIAFIEKFLKKNVRYHHDYYYHDVSVAYFEDVSTADEYIKKMVLDEGFISIELTEYNTRTTNVIKRPSIAQLSKSVHEVIGQEFENVLIPIDNHFYYNSDGDLRSNYNEYYPYLEEEGIFQAFTRTRKCLLLVIINNPDLYISTQELLTKKFEKANFTENV